MESRTENSEESPAPAARQRRRARNQNLGSSLLFAALAVVLAAAAYVYYQDNDESDAPPVPQSTPGSNELIHVRDALANQGFDASLGQGAFRAEGLTPPGQVITLGDGATVYAFIYGTVAEQEAELATVDPAILAITTPSRRPVAGAGSEQPEIHVAAGSNIIAVLAGGSPEQVAQFEAAIATLP